MPEGARPSDEATWHTDMLMFEIPAAASIAYAAEVPAGTGRIRFANLYRAYETLPDDLERAVRGRRSIHDAAYTAMGEVRGGYAAVDDRSRGPGARHPVLRRHPQTGRTALYLGRKGYGYIEGYGVAESDRVLDALWRHMTRPEFVWTHEWRNGDVVMWDNRCCTHMRTAFDPRLSGACCASRWRVNGHKRRRMPPFTGDRCRDRNAFRPRGIRGEDRESARPAQGPGTERPC